jgi:hypothetical protein
MLLINFDVREDQGYGSVPTALWFHIIVAWDLNFPFFVNRTSRISSGIA